MKILFTGASSFTGCWFVKTLAERGHEVTAIFQKEPESYQGVRGQRVGMLSKYCQSLFNCTFGSDKFLRFISQTHEKWDLLCHHAADVSNYKSPDFDPVAALHNNTLNIQPVLKSLAEKGCFKVLLTGSVFEQDEGISPGSSRAFSPYGLSKGLTGQLFRYYAEAHKFKLGKFVIPNPFGPFEEARFTTYLMKCWLEGRAAQVATPDYIRDNIHVDLLAKAYAQFAEALSPYSGWESLHPSGYIESQGAFAKRFAHEIGKRLDITCSVELKMQTEFSEPKVRTNYDQMDCEKLDWCEQKAWDGLADYYAEYLLPELQLSEH